MDIAFLRKHKDLIRKEIAHEGGHWQILEMRPSIIIIVGFYASPSASTQEKMDIKAVFKRLCAKRGPVLACGDLNVRYPSWNLSGKARGSNALQALIKLLQ